MEALFKAETVYTYELYKDFSLAVSRKLNHLSRNYILLAISFFVLGFGIITKEKNVFTLVVWLLADALLLFILRFMTMRQIKKSWDSDSLLKSARSSYIFFSDSFEAVNANGVSNIKYSDLYAVYETKKGIYLMLSNNKGMMIDKAVCSDELVQFLLGIKAK